MSMTSIKSRLPALTLCLGAILRLLTISSAALWYDESVTLYRTTIPFMTIYSNQSDASGSLLLDLAIRLVMWISPHSLILLRLPSLLASLVSLWLVWKIMKELQFTWRQQFYTSLIAAFLPGLLWIGADARSYGLLGMMILAGLYCALYRKWLGLAACLGLLMYCHNTGPLAALGLLAVALYLYPWRARRILLIAALGGLAWIPAVLHVLTLGMTSGPLQPWQPVLNAEWLLRSAMMAVMPEQGAGMQLAALLIVPLTLTLIYSRAWRNHPRTALLLALFLPLLVMTGVSLLWKNILLYRTLMPYLWILSLWLGWELGQEPAPLYKRIMAAAWLAFLGAGLLFWQPADRGGHLDQAAAQIRAHWQPGDLLVYATQTAARPFSYYLSDLPAYNYTDIAGVFLMEPGLERIDTGQPADARRIWLVLPQDGLITPAEMQRLQAAYPHASEPLLQVIYLQAAPIYVYLEDTK